jgi:DNA modification methylase
MDIDHSRPHRGDPTRTTISQQFALFRRIFTDVVTSLEKMVPTMKSWDGVAQLIEDDCVAGLQSLPPNSIGLVLTSPPYVDAIDYPRAHKFSEWWLNPREERCKTENYIGLRRVGTKSTLIADARELAPTAISTMGWLERKSPAKYRLVCKYVLDMAQVITGCRRALHENGKLVFVLADNKMEGRTVPVVNLVKELLVALDFQNVASIRRRIKTGRRRYPFGFTGVMKSEAIITALKT